MEVVKETQLQNMPCTALKGVGPQVALRLKKLGISTVQDVLFHLPLRYQDRTRIRSIGDCQAGESVLIEGEIATKEMPKFAKTRLLLYLQDSQGLIALRFFHVGFGQMKALVPGMRLRCFGEVRYGPKGLEMVHPEYRVIKPGDPLPVEESLTPVYPATEGLHQLSLRRLTAQALQLMHQDSQLGILPETVLPHPAFADITEALAYVHRPPVDADQALLFQGKHPAQQRLAFEELLAHRLSLLMAREKEQLSMAPGFPLTAALPQKLLAQLPFQLTSAQQRVLTEIQTDLSKTHPMLRLVQGDVGCGKTVVAALAALQAIDAGFQVAVMAPTEILAEQHYRNFKHWLTPLSVPVIFLSGRLKTAAKREALQAIANTERSVVIGTHALFQDAVQFAKLGFMIVDEQHRFGVDQRLKLKNKGWHPHQLTMTATPIPRTLAMTAYADLDHSVIDELPPGRKPVKTVIIGDHKRDEVVARVREQCLSKHQAYWVCTLIEESEVLQCQAAEQTAEALQAELNDLTVALVHGRIKADEKERIMQDFKNGHIDLLVATTVIEVGVDVPNANLMIIENPERLGLSQLHQLRGRVGRGSTQSFCVLLYHQPISKQGSDRLSILRDHADGFAVAEKDLSLRGPGELLGTKQSGLMAFRIADIVRDKSLIPTVQACADTLLTSNRPLVSPLIQRWLGHKTHYRQV